MHILPALLDICKFFKQQANGLIQKHQEMDKNSEALTQEILRKLLEIRTNNTIDMVHVKKTKKKQTRTDTLPIENGHHMDFVIHKLHVYKYTKQFC